jgi:hypothetical protein
VTLSRPDRAIQSMYPTAGSQGGRLTGFALPVAGSITAETI